ncbi:MAG: sigma-54 dependent transcriptional regulator, acetoin dehydrogenase operon transcriptional, partial [Streptomyces sp.]|nr:sigma-54 dependent transcriptional regulator, acetoin dehydrogenase operon transcriptional [Streptomyces sp.]
MSDAVQALLRERAIGRLARRTISEAVLASWERCLHSGIEPSGAVPRRVREGDWDARVVAAASRIVAQRRSHIEGADVCVSVTDPDGVILRQWSGTGRVPDTMRRLDIVPGFRGDEGTIGTSSASTLVTGRPLLVQGPEHFASQFSSLTSAGMVIRHPARRSVEGTLNLTCRFADTTPLALAWVCEMVTEIERVLLQDATRAEHMLMERFLSSGRD